MTAAAGAGLGDHPGPAILSIGAYRPEHVVTNDEICKQIDSSDEWIRERSHIVTRHRANDEETVVEMGARAARQAIERAGLEPADIDAVIVATVTHAVQMPAAATVLANRIGATPAAAFDLAAACAGFPYAVAVAADLVRGGSARHVLVVGSEKFSDFIDPTDRGTAFLFGDGAGAVVIGRSEKNGIGPVVWGSDGGGADMIQTPSWLEIAEGTERPWVTMAGQSVFRWAVWSMAPIARKAVDAAGVDLADLSALVPHQANGRIIDAMVKQMDLPPHVHVAKDVVNSGNTSGASIPLALDRATSEGSAAPGSLALLVGFGAGLAWAAQVVRLP